MFKLIKPTTPSARHKIIPKLTLSNLKNNLLLTIKKKSGGRNNTGKITMRHLGGGHKQKIRLVDSFANIGSYSESKLIDFIYDHLKTNYLSLFETKNKRQFLRLSISGQQIGDKLNGKYSMGDLNFNLGSVLPLKSIPVGTKISNVQLNNSNLLKAAGTYGTIIKQDKKNAIVKLASKQQIAINNKNLATIGINNNINHEKTILGKAGVKRWLGIKPTVRGEAMNPIDHPHGGKTSGGVRLKTVYGKLAKFIKTR